MPLDEAADGLGLAWNGTERELGGGVRLGVATPDAGAGAEGRVVEVDLDEALQAMARTVATPSTEAVAAWAASISVADPHSSRRWRTRTWSPGETQRRAQDQTRRRFAASGSDRRSAAE